MATGAGTGAAGAGDGVASAELSAEEQARIKKKQEERERDLQKLQSLSPEDRLTYVQGRLADSPEDTKDSALFGFVGFCRESEKVQSAIKDLDQRVQDLRKADTAFSPFESRWQQAERASAEQAHVLQKIQEDFRKVKRSYDSTMTLVITGVSGLVIATPVWLFTSESTDEMQHMLNVGTIAIGVVSGLVLLIGLPSLPGDSRKRSVLLSSLKPAQLAHKNASAALRGLMESEAGSKRRGLDSAIGHLGDQFGRFDAILSSVAQEYTASLEASRKVTEDAISTYMRNFPPELALPDLERRMAEMTAPPPWFRGATREACERAIADREIFKRMARESYDYVSQRFTTVAMTECPTDARDKVRKVLMDRAGLARLRADELITAPGRAALPSVLQFESEMIKKYLIDAGAKAEVRTGPAYWPRPRAQK